MPMLQIGSVAFKTTGPHYDKMKSSFTAQWARQKRFGRSDAMQWTGEGEDDVSISGTIYTDYYGGFGALSSLRSMSRSPQMVVSGAGDVFGRWCILNVSNEQTLQDASGKPRKVTFDIKLTRYGEDGFDGLGSLGGIGSALGGLGGIGGALGGLGGALGGLGGLGGLGDLAGLGGLAGFSGLGDIAGIAESLTGGLGSLGNIVGLVDQFAGDLSAGVSIGVDIGGVSLSAGVSAGIGGVQAGAGVRLI